MPIREEVPVSNKAADGEPNQSLAELAAAAFEHGAVVVDQAGADVKDPREISPDRPMMGRAVDWVQASAEDFDDIELFGKMRPFGGGSPDQVQQLVGSLQFPKIDGHHVTTPHINLADADSVHFEQGLGSWQQWSGVQPEQGTNVTPLYGNYTLLIPTEDRTPGIGAHAGVYSNPLVAALPPGKYTLSFDILCERDHSAGSTPGDRDRFRYIAIQSADPDVENHITELAANTWEHIEFEIDIVNGSDVRLYFQQYDIEFGNRWHVDRIMIRAGALADVGGAFVPSMFVQDTITPSVRFAPDTNPVVGREHLIGDSNGSGSGWFTAIEAIADTLQFRVLDAGGVKAFNQSFPGMEIGEDNLHTWEWTLSSDAWTTYFNQQQINAGSQAAAPPPEYDPDVPMSIGADPFGNSSFGGRMFHASLRDGLIADNAPIVVLCDFADAVGVDLYDGQTFESGGRTWTVHGDSWPSNAESWYEQVPALPPISEWDAAVKLNGTDQYIQTEDVNLLDADTAHLYQSSGKWEAVTNGSFDIIDTNLGFSGKAIEAISDGVGNLQHYWSGTQDFAATAATQYVLGLNVQDLSGKPIEARLRFFWRDSGGASIIAADGPWTAIPANGIERLEFAATAPASTAYARPRVEIRQQGSVVPDAGDTYRYADALYAEGSDATFLPSFRVVGDNDLRTDLAADDWSPGAFPWIFAVGSAIDRYGFYQINSGGVNGRYGEGGSERDTGNIAVPTDDGGRHTFRAAWDISAGTADVWYDGVQGTQVTGFPTGPGFATGPLTIGKEPTLGPYVAGNIYGIQVRDGIGGPILVEFDARELEFQGPIPAGYVHTDKSGRKWTFPNGAEMVWSLPT